MAMLMSSGENAATLLYGPNGYRVIKPGRFVTCAVTGEPIPLEELRYYFILAADLEYAATTAERESSDEIGRMLHAYIDTLSSKES